MLVGHTGRDQQTRVRHLCPECDCGACCGRWHSCRACGTTGEEGSVRRDQLAGHPGPSRCDRVVPEVLHRGGFGPLCVAPAPCSRTFSSARERTADQPGGTPVSLAFARGGKVDAPCPAARFRPGRATVLLHVDNRQRTRRVTAAAVHEQPTCVLRISASTARKRSSSSSWRSGVSTSFLFFPATPFGRACSSGQSAMADAARCAESPRPADWRLLPTAQLVDLASPPRPFRPARARLTALCTRNGRE